MSSLFRIIGNLLTGERRGEVAGHACANIHSFGPIDPQSSHSKTKVSSQNTQGGWSGGAMVLGKLPVPGRPTCLD